MKKFFSSFLLVAFFFTGCSDKNNNVTNPGGGIGNIGGNNSSVTFTVEIAQGQQGTIFVFKPSTDVTLTTITLNLPEQQFTDTVQNPNPDEVYNPQDGFQIGEYTGVESGQKWNFRIQGKIGSATDNSYDVTVNYTIP